MINTLILEQLQEINLLVIDIIKKEYGEIKKIEDDFYFQVRLNKDGSLRLGFQSLIFDNTGKHKFIDCESSSDFEYIKTTLRERL